MAVLAAVIRGFASRGTAQLGNFWRDLIRTPPLHPAAALDPRSRSSSSPRACPDARRATSPSRPWPAAKQVLALGPVASQVAIKQLGTNGGGFFNVNCALPFENPSGLSGFVETLFILLIPAGRRRPSAAWSAAAARAGRCTRRWWRCWWRRSASPTAPSRWHPRPARGRDARPPRPPGAPAATWRARSSASGSPSSAEWATTTTAASNGSVNSAHDSYTGAAARSCSLNMMTGEVIFGGVGSGLYGMLLFVLLAVFIAGLMVGRTPEYLGKKIEAREIKLVLVGVLSRCSPCSCWPPSRSRSPTSTAPPPSTTRGRRASRKRSTPTPRRATTTARPSPAIAGFVQPNAPGNVGAYGITFADLLGGLSMFVARFVPLLAALAVAGSLAIKRIAPLGAGTFRTDTPTFVVLLIFVVADRRRAHLLAGAAARPDRPVAHRPSSSECRASDILLHPPSRPRPHGRCSGCSTRWPHRRRPGALPRQVPTAAGSSVDGRLVGSELIGQNFRGLPRYFQSAPLGHRLRGRRHRLQQPRPQQPRAVAVLLPNSSAPTCGASGPMTARSRRRGPSRCRDDVGLRRRPADLAGQRAHPGPPRRRGARPPAAGACST